jgi:hypothetical protein
MQPQLLRIGCIEILIIIQRFGKHCSCHLQGECAESGNFLKPYTWHAVDGK